MRRDWGRRGGGCLLLPLLEGSHPHSSRPGLSPDGTQVGTCGGGGGWANAHPPMTTAVSAPGDRGFPFLRPLTRWSPNGALRFPASRAGVHQGRARRSPKGLWACSRSQWGRGSPKACEGGGQGRGQVGVGRGGLPPRRNSRSDHPRAPTGLLVSKYSLSVEKRRFILFYFFIADL